MIGTHPNFIVIEGLDGTGKSTQVKLLQQALREELDWPVDVHRTAQPSSGPVGKMIREILTGQVQLLAGSLDSEDNNNVLSLLFAADRIEHVADDIAPRLARGEIVISDRYDLSSLVYQGAGDLEQLAWVELLNSRVVCPGLTLYLEAGLDVSYRRINERGGPGDGLEYLERLRTSHQRYRQCVEVHKATRKIRAIDASCSIEEVHSACLRHALEHLEGSRGLLVGQDQESSR